MAVDPLRVLDARKNKQDALRMQPRLFLRTPNPITEALWMALLRPAHTLLAEAARGFEPVDNGPPSDDPDERQHVIPPKSAIEVMAEAAVVRALQGDTKAFAVIAERIEGKVGIRKGDDDPEALQREEQSRGIVERIVSELTTHRISVTTDADVNVALPPEEQRLNEHETTSLPRSVDVTDLYDEVLRPVVRPNGHNGDTT